MLEKTLAMRIVLYKIGSEGKLSSTRLSLCLKRLEKVLYRNGIHLSLGEVVSPSPDRVSIIKALSQPI